MTDSDSHPESQRTATQENTCRQTKHKHIKKTSPSIWQHAQHLQNTLQIQKTTAEEFPEDISAEHDFDTHVVATVCEVIEVGLCLCCGLTTALLCTYWNWLLLATRRTLCCEDVFLICLFCLSVCVRWALWATVSFGWNEYHSTYLKDQDWKIDFMSSM